MLPQQPGQSEQVRKWINTHTPEPHLPLLSTAPRRRHTQEVLIQLASKAIKRVFEPTTYFVACLHAPFPLVYWTCVPLFHVVGNAVTRSINSGTIFRNAKKIKKSKKTYFSAPFFIFVAISLAKLCRLNAFFVDLGEMNEWISTQHGSRSGISWYISYINHYYYIHIYIRMHMYMQMNNLAR